MAAVEAVDPGVFERTFKRQTNRIVPHVIIIACYGESGICWEPFERYNRATSRGRIAVPLFPKDLKNAVISALGDLRWQVAKEKAQHYWMEEGLTGNYYQWFEEKIFTRRAVGHEGVCCCRGAVTEAIYAILSIAINPLPDGLPAHPYQTADIRDAFFLPRQ